tara:strand:+ start:336 stop:557 length:222 start_codon:yes stop_codon:yes gene_type:complete
MSANLIEFIKVFTLVFAFSGLILAGRRYMLKWDDVDKENNIVSSPNQNDEIDSMDYDGMGNYGRFPEKTKTRK